VSSTGQLAGNSRYITNYAVNYLVFNNNYPKVPSSFPDGPSTTVLLYERYANCQGDTAGNNNPPCPWDSGGNANGNHAIAYGPSGNDNWNYVPTLPIPLFQSQPTVATCDNATTQGMHYGENVLMGDASVKLVSPQVSQTSWSAAFTPNGLDTVSNDF
jgi:hypothetical protein